MQGSLRNGIKKSTIRSRCRPVAACWSQFQDWCSHSCSNGRPRGGNDSDTWTLEQRCLYVIHPNAGGAIGETNEHHRRELSDHAKLSLMGQACSSTDACSGATCTCLNILVPSMQVTYNSFWGGVTEPIVPALGDRACPHAVHPLPPYVRGRDTHPIPPYKGRGNQTSAKTYVII